MDWRGTSAETQRRTKARTEPCPATEGRPDADRLSALSDELLLHILSFLRIREAVSTSCLSRRWRRLYHDLPSLDFSAGFDNDSACLINRVLLLHAAPRIEVFRLFMRDEREDSFAYRQIDSWLLLVVRRGVRVLDLRITVGDPDEPSYRLPPWVFHCTTLEDLSVDNCHLHQMPSHVRLVALKKMHLCVIEFHDDALKRLLLGCPLLQSLKLVHCNKRNDLVIDARGSRNLEELVIADAIDDVENLEMQIYAPSVKYLTLYGFGLTREYKVRDLSSVVVASFHLDGYGEKVVFEDEADEFATGLLLRIPQVQVLKLCRWSLQFDNRDPDETESPQLLAHNSDSVMQDLKTIVIQGLKRDNIQALGKEIDIVLIGFLLQVSPVLEKLIVQPSKGMDGMPRKWELLFNLLSELISLPRASPKAQVIIDQK